ncbi:hypothetical protein FOL47_000995 [Perkinsus chesapeaki]|uniref:subtilisin n=1 Tax=Perkinsus chesapeaki TaxID=330153 RepID=A0A7J6MKN0_PERCH|nr:hypothetical protein FOL47_000995 [Perkinsus chesapeaki]
MLGLFFTLGYLIASSTATRSSVGKTGVPPVNDPDYKHQAPYFDAINIPKAWRRLTSTRVLRQKVTVALIDTGVKYNHPDLVGNLVTGYNVIRNSTDTDDKAGHGTMMAGVLGATINNSIGIAGVMDLVNIMPISLEENFVDEPEAASLQYAIETKDTRRIKIILMAFSGNILRPKVAQKIRQAVQAGMLVIVTAGNYGINVTVDKRYPCVLTQQLTGMLCVAGTEQSKMRLGTFSNFANYVDIAAPGNSIITTAIRYPYTKFTGTSPAAAIVAGVASMLYSLAPGLTPADVRKIL